MSSLPPTDHRAKYTIYRLYDSGWQSIGMQHLPYRQLAAMVAKLAASSGACYAIDYCGRIVERFMPPVTKTPSPMRAPAHSIEMVIRDFDRDFHINHIANGASNKYDLIRAATVADAEFNILLADRERAGIGPKERGIENA